MWSHFGKRPLNRNASALTLVEVLLAAAFSSGLFLVTAFLLRNGFDASSRWEASIAPVHHMERGLMRLEQDVESMRPFFGAPCSGAPGEITLARLEATPTSDGEAVPTWMRVVYRVEGGSLIREAFRWQDGEGALPLSHETLMPIEHAAFSFGMLDAQQHLVWESAWDGETLWTPRLVKLTGTLPAIGERTSVALSRIFRNPAGNLPVLETP